LALPRLLTKGLPPSWGELFIPNQNAAAWLTSFAAFAEDLSSTETVGQLAYYIPAPNPVIMPGENPATVWSGLTIESLLGRLKMDPASLIGRSINTDLYELDEIVLAGWAEADLLGIPLGDARLRYDGDARRLEARADIKPGSWFGEFFTGKATFAVQLPSDQETGLVTYSTSQLFDHIGNNITGLSGPQLQARVTEIQQSLAGALPRISATVDAGVTIPPAFADFVRGGANVGFFAYSPYFDPDFEPANDRPEAIAKRQGGLGIEGDLQIGYFSPDGNPNNDVFINTTASLALSVPTGPGPPGLSGDFELSTGSLNVPLGDGPAAALTNLRLTLNTDPAVGKNYLLASGSAPSIDLGGFMRIDPRSGSNIGGDFIVKRIAQNGPPSVDLALRPAKVTFPGLANNDLNLLIHGVGNVNSDFTLSTSGDFGAQITLSGGITLNDPFNNNLPFVTLTGPEVTGTISRTAGVTTASFNLPEGFSATFHPLGQIYSLKASASVVLRSDGSFDLNFESSGALEIPDFFRIGPPSGGTSQLHLTRNSGGIAKLRIQAPQLTLFPGNNGLNKPVFALPDLIEIESTGRFYVNSGSRTMDLFGAVQASGNLEFGYEPTPPGATFSFTKSTSTRAFGTTFRGLAATLPLTINNTGTARLTLALELSGAGASNYHLSQSSLSLTAGASHTLNITFIAKGNGNAATLTLRPLSGNAPPQTVTLTAGTTAPTTLLGDLVRSEPTVSFGQVAAGLREARSSLLINTGLAPVDIPSVTVPSGVSIQGSVVGTLAPGETRVVPLVYQPAAAGATSGSLSYNTTAGTRTTTLAGSAVNRNFIKILSTSRPFASLSMTGDFGTAVDVDGKTWRTTNQGVTWKPESIPSLPVSADLKPRVLQATGSGGSQFKWLVGSKGEYWQSTPTSTWVKDLTPAVTNPDRDWNAVALQSSLGAPLALVTGNQGTAGVILRETTPGNFSELTFPGTTLRSLVTNASDLTALAIGDGGKLLRSTDGGATFASTSVAATTANLLAADISTNTGTATTRTAVIGASGARIFRSANGGSSWSAATISAPGFALGDIVSVAIEGTRGLAVDSNGILLSSANSGTTWTAAEQGFTRSPIRSIARSGSDFWALTENGEIHYRIPDGGLTMPPLTLLDDQLELGFIPTTTPGPHTRTTGLTNVGTTTLNLTLTPSSSAVTVTPATVSIPAGQTIGVRISLASTSALGSVKGSVEITATGFPQPLTIGIGGFVQSRTWAAATRFTTSDLVDTETRDANIRHALSGTHFYQTLNRGTLWTERALPTGSNRAMFFTSSTTGVVVGGSSSLARIYRTTDSGATWSTAHSESRALNTAGRAVMDVHLRSTNVGYAVTRGALTLASQFRAGQLLRTTDGGATWTAIAGPASDPDFSGVSVHAVSDTFVFVAANGTIWSYNFTTNLWTAVRSFGRAINRVRFATDNTTGWIVGENSLFAITTTGGTTSGSWGPFLELFPTDGIFNGLCFDTTGQARTILNRPGAMEIWKQGATASSAWTRDPFPFAVDENTPRGRAIDMAVGGAQGTIVGDGGAIWMYDATPAPLPDLNLITAPQLDFGVQREGGNPVTLNLTVLNPTLSTVRINDVIIDNLGTEGSFSAALGTVTLNAGSSTVIPVTFSGLSSGNHEAVLTVISDNPVGLHARVRLSAIVQEEPAGLVVRTSPPSLSMSVGGNTSTAAATRIIRDGAAGTGELSIGQTLPLNAPVTQAAGGVTYKFSNWTGAAGGAFAINPAVENTSRLTEAVYRPLFPVTTVLLPESPTPTGGSAPTNRNGGGPWIRLTGARLIVPNLRDFAVSGEMFLSGEAIKASLASTAFQVPSSTSVPVLEVGSGSWLLDWAKGQAFRFSSSSPSLKVFNSDLLPSATADLTFAGNGDFGMNFSLPEGFQDVTGMVEIAPDGAIPAQVGFSFNNNIARFNLSGRLRALSNGQGGWLVDKNVNISNSAAIFPQTLTITTPIPLGAFSITQGSLSLTRNGAGVIGVGLSGVTMTGPLGTLTGLGASVDSSGLATFTQSGPITFGPFQLVPQFGSTRIALNALTASLAITLPDSHLNAVAGTPFSDRWPDDTISFPGFSFDSSGSFDRKIALPSLSIDGIGLNSGGNLDKNYIRFKRDRAGTLSVIVRDRQTFFDNTSDLEFEIRSDGILRGKYFGEMSFFRLQFGTVSMSYNP
ncbi:MAG: hypothetical protein JWL81_1469, partial [Verrucomicrobiales bacterium]|nr:hypothetical protein [Verrucomicrobiales bacterium]